MQLKTYLFCLVFGWAGLYLNAQSGTTAKGGIYSPKDSILLLVKDNQKLVQHRVKPGQTLYSLTRFYNLGMEELYRFNPELQSAPGLKSGQILQIPIPNLAIKRYKGDKFAASRHASIYYVVQKGDNLYQICQRYFNMPVDTIVQRNRLKGNSLKPGQKIHMGWLQLDGIQTAWRPVEVMPTDSDMQARFDQEKGRLKEYEGQGVCFWHRESQERGDLYALHREARIGTTIEVFNPLGGRKVYAKVIGRIPAGYESNIEIILSPEAARKLGARDPRFFVRLKYLK